MLDPHFKGNVAHLFAQSPGHGDYAAYRTTATALRAAIRDVRRLIRIRPLEQFEHAWVIRAIDLVGDPDAEPAVRRYISQSLDEHAVSRGLLLTPHWHCPRCGAPGSQWTEGCTQTYCDHPPPARRAHWDHCRVASLSELLTLMVSEGYQRVGALAAAAELQTLQSAWRALLDAVPSPLVADLERWARDVHDAHAARAAEILGVAASLGHAIQLDDHPQPERLLRTAIEAAGYTHPGPGIAHTPEREDSHGRRH